MANLPPEDAQRYVGFIKVGVQQMEQLIQDLLLFAGHVQNEKSRVEPVELNVCLGQAVETLHLPIESSSARIVAGDLPVVMAETAQITQFFQSLLSNAIKYAKRNIPPSIQIGSVRNGHECVSSVRDNGIGFSQEYAEHVFGLFKRLQRNEYPGTSLGLAICKRVVERYGGRIWVESVLGEGSTFFFSLSGVE